MMKGYDIYSCTSSIDELFDYIQSQHIEIFDIKIENTITFLSTVSYRKKLYEHPQIHYLYTKGIIGMIFRFFMSKEKMISFYCQFFYFLYIHIQYLKLNIMVKVKKHLNLIQANLKKYQIPFLFLDSNEMYHQMMKLNDQLNWYALIQKGSKLEIHFLPRKTLTISKNHPYDLIATSEGIIASFDISKGIKTVKINQKVNVGDILVSHILIDSKNEEKTTNVLGKVYAFTFKKIEIEIQKDNLPLAVQYYKCMLISRMKIQLDKDERIIKEIPLQFYEDFDTIKMSNFYVLYEMIAGVGESYE